MFVGISKAPDDPDARDEWVKKMAEIQLGMIVGDGKQAKCSECGKYYTSIQDLMDRAPKMGLPGEYVDMACWPAYEKKHGRYDDEQ